MALSVPIRYINDGEPLNEETLNRYGLDSQTNLEVLFNTVDGYDPGTVEAEANRVVLRDDQGRSKFGVPTHDQHVWRVAEYKEFREFLLDNADYIRLERLRKASTTQEGVVQLIDSYSSTSMVKAPTANALRDAYQDLLDRIEALEDSQISLAYTVFQDDTRENLATTPKAVWDAINNFGGEDFIKWFEDRFGNEYFGSGGFGDIIGWSWQELPGGFKVIIGAGVTDENGNCDIFFPITFPNGRVAFSVNESSSSGWNGAVASPLSEPTVYGVDLGHFGGGGTGLNSIRVECARIHNDGIPRIGTGCQFHWIAWGH